MLKDPNVTLHFKIEKLSMKDVSSEAERYKVYDSSLKFMMNIKTDLTNIGKNYTVSDKDNQ